MDNEHKRAQDQIDQIMAEVTRLTEVARGLEKSNEAAQNAHDAKTASLNESIARLTSDKAVIEGNIAKVKDDFTERQNDLSRLKSDIQTCKVAVADLNVLIARKEKENTLTNESGEKAINKFETIITEKEAELVALEKKKSDTLKNFESELASVKLAIFKAENELTALQDSISTAETHLSNTERETKRSLNEAILAEQRLETAKDERTETERIVLGLQEEKAAILADVEPLRAQIAGEREQLKALTKERIQMNETNREIVAQLTQREAILREKYEEVGLEYK